MSDLKKTAATRAQTLTGSKKKTERLEDIPEAGTSLRIDNFAIEILQATDNAVKTVRIRHLTGKEKISEDAAIKV